MQFYSCCVIYAMNYWVVTLPCLLYLTSFGTCPSTQATVPTSAKTTNTAIGIAIIYYEVSEANIANRSSIAVKFYHSYFEISLSLNILLMAMIFWWFALRSRRIKNDQGTSTMTSEWYRAAAIIFTESYALYVVNYLLFFGPWGTGSYIAGIFSPILVETQVRAAFASS